MSPRVCCLCVKKLLTSHLHIIAQEVLAMKRQPCRTASTALHQPGAQASRVSYTAEPKPGFSDKRCLISVKGKADFTQDKCGISGRDRQNKCGSSPSTKPCSKVSIGNSPSPSFICFYPYIFSAAQGYRNSLHFSAHPHTHTAPPSPQPQDPATQQP